MGSSIGAARERPSWAWAAAEAGQTRHVLEDPGARLPRWKLHAEKRCSEEQQPAGRRIGGVWTASFVVVGSGNRNKTKGKEKEVGRMTQARCRFCCAWLRVGADARPCQGELLCGCATLVPPQSPGSAGFKPGVPTGGLTF